MAMNISCKFEKASYNIFFDRAVTVKSLYTLRRRRRRWRRRRRNEVKSIVSPDAIRWIQLDQMNCSKSKIFHDVFSKTAQGRGHYDVKYRDILAYVAKKLKLLFDLFYFVHMAKNT